MKPVRLILAVLVALGLLGLALYYRPGASPSGGERFTTPANCVDAYAEACRNGDVEGFRATLAEPLRGQCLEGLTDPGKQVEAVRLRMEGIKSWIQRGEAAVDGDEATVTVEEVRQGGTLRVRFHLKRAAGAWGITKIEAPEEVKTPVRFGTPASGPER